MSKFLFPLLFAAMAVSWFYSLWRLAVFVRDGVRRSSRAELAALAALLLFPFLASLAVTVRGNYDNDHDFYSLSMSFFGSGLWKLFGMKEIAPLFTDWVSDLLTGNSLGALPWKNRIVFAVSGGVFFLALRRAGAGIAAAFASSALLFWSFLSLVLASSFSTAGSNLLAVCNFLAAVSALHAGAAPSPAGAAWVAAGLTLVAGSRYEFLPGCVLLLVASVWMKRPDWAVFRFKWPFLALLAALGLAWGAYLSGTPGSFATGVINSPRPADNFVYQISRGNLMQVLGESPDFGVRLDCGGGVCVTRPKARYKKAAAVAALFAAALLGGVGLWLYALGPRRGEALPPLFALTAWAAWFILIFFPADYYPFQFARHRVYFLVPVALLSALSFSGFAAFAGKVPARLAAALLAASAAAFAGGNLAAAVRGNPELRTNDLELKFLVRAQKDWPEGCEAYHYEDSHFRADFLKKRFPYRHVCGGCGDDCGDSSGSCVLHYRSPVPHIYENAMNGKRPPPSFQGEPWRSESFTHAYYTSTVNSPGVRGRETAKPLPLTVGFYRMSKPDILAEISYCHRPEGAAAEALRDLPSGYDPARDAGADLGAALRLASRDGRRVLMLVGGDWCSWCAVMDKFFASNPDAKALRDGGYVVLKVFSNPSIKPPQPLLKDFPRIPGYPHIFVLEKDGRLLESVDTTRLELGGGYDRGKFMELLDKWHPSKAPAAPLVLGR